MTSEMYTPENTNNALTKKAHQQRACAVCQQPVVDEKAATLPIGGGLELKVHRTCMQELVEAMSPVTVTIPVPTSKPVRKATYAPYDQDRMAASIKKEMYQLLLDEAMRQRG